MGLPVVTWPGHSFAGRHSQSHLNAAGLTDTIADSADAYVAIVERLNADRTALAARRSAQRAQIAASPLADADRFAAHLHDAWRGAWRIWCATQGRG
jgi:predicted O-linked N-acetylglucosamine transferase (SPINDLY family)